MAAVVRLKRHLDDEPLSALILNCKKRKKNDENDCDSEVSTVLAFAGTINSQDDDISSHISKLSKEDLENTYKKHIPNLTSKNRQQTKQSSDDSRFKVVNFFRSIDKDNPEQNSVSLAKSKLPYTVLDVETTNQSEKEETNYVYDLYYTDSEGINNSESDTEFQICPANEIIFDDGTLQDSDHDTDDSNDENNWRNDYPEEDDDSIDEEDMLKAVDRLSLNEDSDDDSSIDNRPDGFMYSIDSEAVGFEEDVDFADGRRYGELYARFKMRQKREEENYNKDLYHGEIDDTDDDYYDD